MVTLLTHLLFLVFLSAVTSTHSSPLLSFVYGGCSHIKYTSDSDSDTYKANLNSLLTSLMNSATYSSYNHLTIHGTSTQSTTVHGLYQCRGDLSMPDCASCVANSASRLGSFCPDTCGAAMQLQGCFLKYDNDSFVGAQDKIIVVKKCGPEQDGGVASTRDAVLDKLVSGASGSYRSGGSGEVHAMAQCVGDLSEKKCNDCVLEAVTQVKAACGVSGFGDMYLGKCYVRYTLGDGNSFFSTADNNHFISGPEKNRGAKTFAWIIGLLAAIAILVIFFTFLCRAFGKTPGK